MSADIITEAFEIVTSMENDLEDARVLADGVAILAMDAIHDNEKLSAVFLPDRLADRGALRRAKEDAASFSNCCIQTAISLRKRGGRTSRTGHLWPAKFRDDSQMG